MIGSCWAKSATNSHSPRGWNPSDRYRHRADRKADRSRNRLSDPGQRPRLRRPVAACRQLRSLSHTLRRRVIQRHRPSLRKGIYRRLNSWRTETRPSAKAHRAGVPGAERQRYFFLRAPDFLAARNEIPARMAFCWTAAAVRPSWRATALVGVPAFASCFRVRSSPALQEAPSFEGRFAISLRSNHPSRASCG
jgi:hypothetical protein